MQNLCYRADVSSKLFTVLFVLSRNFFERLLMWCVEAWVSSILYDTSYKLFVPCLRKFVLLTKLVREMTPKKIVSISIQCSSQGSRSAREICNTNVTTEYTYAVCTVVHVI
jgi:hypothetical protein